MSEQPILPLHKQSCQTDWMGDYYCKCYEAYTITTATHDSLCLNAGRYDSKECDCNRLLQARLEGYNDGYNEGYRDGSRTGDYLP